MIIDILYNLKSVLCVEKTVPDARALVESVASKDYALTKWLGVEPDSNSYFRDQLDHFTVEFINANSCIMKKMIAFRALCLALGLTSKISKMEETEFLKIYQEVCDLILKRFSDDKEDNANAASKTK
jgi:hypothetical protein